MQDEIKTFSLGVAIVGILCLGVGIGIGYDAGKSSPNTNYQHTIITITNLPPGVSNIVIYPAGPSTGGR